MIGRRTVLALTTLLTGALIASCANSSSPTAAGSASGPTDPCIKSMKSSGEVQVGETNYLPVGQVKNGQFVGILADIIADANKRAGLPTKLIPVTMPFDSLIPSLQSHRITISGDTLTPTDERKKHVLFADNVWYITVQMMVKKGNPKNLHSLEDAAKAGAKVTTFEGSTWLPTLQAVHGIKVSPVSSFSAMVAGVISGQTDAAIVDSLSLSWAQKVNPSLDVEAASSFTWPGGAASTPTSIAVPMDCPTYQKDLNTAMAAMRADGTFNTYMTKWGLLPISQFASPTSS